jgi:hypothetical protein
MLLVMGDEVSGTTLSHHSSLLVITNVARGDVDFQLAFKQADFIARRVGFVPERGAGGLVIT